MILETFLIFAMADIHLRLKIQRNAAFKQVKREVHALAAFHHRSIGQLTRQQIARLGSNPNLF